MAESDTQDEGRELEGGEAWREAYEGRRPFFRRLERKLELLIDELVEGEALSVAPIEVRTKEVDSFVEKIDRKNYEAPFDQMMDIVGVRVIAYYVDDCRQIGKLVEREFDVDDDHSSRGEEPRDPDRFGYESLQYVVSLRPDRAALTDWAPFAGLKFEIQVRTVLQTCMGRDLTQARLQGQRGSSARAEASAFPA